MACFTLSNHNNLVTMSTTSILSLKTEGKSFTWRQKSWKHFLTWSSLAVLHRAFSHCIFYCKYGHLVGQLCFPIIRHFSGRKTLNCLVIKEKLSVDESNEVLLCPINIRFVSGLL